MPETRSVVKLLGILGCVGALLPTQLVAQGTLFVSEDRVGIGTETPDAALEARGNQASSLWGTTFHNTESSQFTLRRAMGSEGSPAAPTTSQILGAFSFRGYDGLGFTGSKAFIAAAADQNWTPSGNATQIFFSTTAVDSTTLAKRMTIRASGRVGIGTDGPASLLHVSGGDVRVSGGSFIDDGVVVADYVFEPGYALMNLGDLAAFIEEHRHLPNVPTQSEVDEGGLDVSRFVVTLLEKVEELTLYTIFQQETIDELGRERTELATSLSDLEGRNAELEERLSAIETLLAPR